MSHAEHDLTGGEWCLVKQQTLRTRYVLDFVYYYYVVYYITDIATYTVINCFYDTTLVQ